jgi:hypothetical protein
MRREANATAAPAAAKDCAACRPIPLEAPDISTVLPFMLNKVSMFIGDS